ncbi:MAG: hypothetical protein LBH68_08270, partial [Bifidobacteriaceae bacterium]|nr:hypothetical protein [Bifidobacteriaceae bacterium]
MLLDRVGLVPPAENLAEILGGQVQLRHSQGRSGSLLLDCGPSDDGPAVKAEARNTWSLERRTGAVATYALGKGKDRIRVEIGVYELGQTTLPEDLAEWNYPDEELIAGAENCYNSFAATSQVDPPTVGQAIATAPQRAPSGFIVLPATDVEASSAFYGLDLNIPDELAEDLGADTPLLDIEARGWVTATAFWVVDSKFLVALAIDQRADRYPTLAETLDSIHLAEIVDLTTTHVHEHGIQALETPGASQTAVPGPPEWVFE